MINVSFASARRVCCRRCRCHLHHTHTHTNTYSHIHTTHSNTFIHICTLRSHYEYMLNVCFVGACHAGCRRCQRCRCHTRIFASTHTYTYIIHSLTYTLCFFLLDAKRWLRRRVPRWLPSLPAPSLPHLGWRSIVANDGRSVVLRVSVCFLFASAPSLPCFGRRSIVADDGRYVIAIIFVIYTQFLHSFSLFCMCLVRLLFTTHTTTLLITILEHFLF
jgi:hypothetical protein